MHHGAAAYLREGGYNAYIVSAVDIDSIRAISVKAYGIAPERVAPRSTLVPSAGCVLFVCRCRYNWANY